MGAHKLFFINSGSWLNDGFCDDYNNHVTCNYDGGDCCGRSVDKRFCLNCTCKCKYFSFQCQENLN